MTQSHFEWRTATGQIMGLSSQLLTLSLLKTGLCSIFVPGSRRLLRLVTFLGNWHSCTAISCWHRSVRLLKQNGLVSLNLHLELFFRHTCFRPWIPVEAFWPEKARVLFSFGKSCFNRHTLNMVHQRNVLHELTNLYFISFLHDLNYK